MNVRLIVLAVAVLFAWRVEAAEPVFPAGSRVGLVPPAGLVPSKAFEGFEDRDRRVAIVLVQLAAAAYADIEKGFNAESLKAAGTEVDSRTDIALKDGHGFIVAAHQGIAGSMLRKWILVALTGNVTALVNAQVPEAAMDTYPEDRIRAALESVVVRDAVPIEEELGLLPYQLKDLAGFRIVHAATNGAVLMTDGPDDAIDLDKQAVFVITVGPDRPEQPGERESLARRVIATTPGVKDMRIERAESMRIGGLPGHEMIVHARDAKTDKPLTIVQWLRFGSGGYMRLLGMARDDDWTKSFARFRTVRDGVEPK